MGIVAVADVTTNKYFDSQINIAIISLHRMITDVGCSNLFEYKFLQHGWRAVIYLNKQHYHIQ